MVSLPRGPPFDVLDEALSRSKSLFIREIRDSAMAKMLWAQELRRKCLTWFVFVDEPRLSCILIIEVTTVALFTGANATSLRRVGLEPYSVNDKENSCTLWARRTAAFSTIVSTTTMSDKENTLFLNNAQRYRLGDCSTAAMRTCQSASNEVRWHGTRECYPGRYCQRSDQGAYLAAVRTALLPGVECAGLTLWHSVDG